MPLGFGSHTSCTRFTIFLDKFAESRPGIIVADEVHCLILTRMSREDMVMLVAQNSEPEVIGIRDVYETIVLRYDISELQETGGGAENVAAEAAEQNRSVSLHRAKTWPQLMCCALV